MAKAEATVSVRIELSNYQELLRTYHALGEILMAMRPDPEDHTDGSR